MKTIDFSEAKLGDRYVVCINKEGEICGRADSATHVNATVIGIAKTPERYDGRSILLGWKMTENRVPASFKRSGKQSAFIDFVDNAKDYSFSLMVSRDTEVHTKITTQVAPNTGYSCIRCREPFPYAEANQPDGTFKCYSCRADW